MNFLLGVLILQLIFFPAAAHASENGSVAEQKADYYQCSMHPWIVSDKPGNCPVCGMALTKVRGGSAGETKKGRTVVEISPERQQLIGVTKDKAEIRPLVYSIHSVGHVAYNPDVATSLAEYQEAYAAYRRNRGNPPTRERAMNVLELAELKLRLAGTSSEQLEEIKSASFDTRVFNKFFVPKGLSLPEGHVWVDTDLYEPDSERTKPGDEVLMTSPALPGKTFKGTVKVADTVLNEFPRKVRVRIETEHANSLKAGMAVDVRIKINLGEKLSIPEDALLDSGLSQIVFVDQGEGHFEPRDVQVGERADGYDEIIAGLHEGETVATSAVFLIDSESRLRAVAQSFSKNNPAEAAPASGHQH